MNKISNLCLLALLVGVLGVSSASYAETHSEATKSRQCISTQAGIPSLFIWDYENLEYSKAQIKASNSKYLKAYEALLERADDALDNEPYSVRDKTKTPPSGDKADYYSIGPYWWPNPKKKDGLPYIRKDGVTNPERNDNSFDSLRMSHMANDASDLALAGYFSGDPRYSQKSAEMLRTWFIDPETKMNPNMNFAQAIPGKVDGRGIGIIDSYRFVKLVDSIGLLEQAGALKSADIAALQDWFGAYAVWMLKSDNGKEERQEVNNHGIYYDVQLATFAAFAGDMGAVKMVTEGVKKSRIPGQIAKDGKLPLELKRTRPFHYTAYTAQAFFDAADIAECIGEDLWTFETFRGQGLKPMIDFHAKYAGRHTVWPYKEVRKIKGDGLYRNLLRAYQTYGDENYRKAINLYNNEYPQDISILLYPIRENN